MPGRSLTPSLPCAGVLGSLASCPPHLCPAPNTPHGRDTTWPSRPLRAGRTHPLPSRSQAALGKSFQVMGCCFGNTKLSVLGLSRWRPLAWAVGSSALLSSFRITYSWKCLSGPMRLNVTFIIIPINETWGRSIS